MLVAVNTLRRNNVLRGEKFGTYSKLRRATLNQRNFPKPPA